MSEGIDVVTTSFCRPDLLELTYRTFFGRIIGLPKPRIIINVDPLGHGSAEECVKIAKRFSSDICWRCPTTPSFASAVKWCYQQVESDVVLHLEDDWFLKRSVDYRDWENVLLSEQSAQCVLPMKGFRQNNSLTYSFRPHLCVREKVVIAIESNTCNANPEQDLRDHSPTLESVDYTRAGPRIISDMGRKWSKYHGFKKSDNPDFWFEFRSKNIIQKLEYEALMRYWRYSAPRY